MKSEQSILVGGLIGLALSIQFTIQPLLTYADPSLVFIAGIAIGLSVLACALHLTGDRNIGSKIAYSSIYVAVACTTGVMLDAVIRAERSRKHCAQIERALLQPPKDARSDLPAVFSALGCKQQL